MLKKSSYWSDIAWLVSGNALATAIGVAAMPLLTRLYAPQNFALQALFVQALGVLCVVQTLRYEYLIQLPKIEAEAQAMLGFVFWFGLAAGIIGLLPAWLGRVGLARLLGSADLSRWLVYLPPTATLVSVAIALEHYAQRRKRYQQASMSEVANKSFYVGSALLGYFILPIPAGLMLATAIGALAKILWLSAPLIHQAIWGHSISPAPAALGGRQLMRQVAVTYHPLSRSMVPSHLLQWASVLIPSAFVMNFYGASALGNFALAVGTISMPTTLIAASVGKVYYQRSADRWAHGAGFADLWSETFRKVLYLGVPLYLIVALIAPWAYPFAFGASWLEAGRYGSLLAISAFFSFISTPLDRGCFIVNAVLYILIWNALRALGVAVVAFLAFHYHWPILTFVAALTTQMGIMYLIDLTANYRFAHRICRENELGPGKDYV